MRSTLAQDAHQLAFKIAQSLERTLVAKAIRLAASNADQPVEVSVSARHVLCALDGSSLEEACLQIGIDLDGKAKSLETSSLAS